VAEFQAVLVRQHQRGGDQVELAALQPGAGLLYASAGDEFGFRHFLVEDACDDGAGNLGTIDYQYAIQLLGHVWSQACRCYLFTANLHPRFNGILYKNL